MSAKGPKGGSLTYGEGEEEQEARRLKIDTNAQKIRVLRS